MQELKLFPSLVALFFCLLAPAASPAAPSANAAEPSVTVLPVPNQGIQPQAAVDASGALHLIYFKGDPAHGDLFYVKKPAGSKSPFSAPIQVNSLPGSVLCKGTIRGGQLALGKAGAVYVTWNTSRQTPNYEHVVGFSQLDAKKTSFEPQRTLGLENVQMDGGDTIAADPKGNVYVFWHSSRSGEDDASGRIYMSKSADGGKTFTKAIAVDNPARGACGCCSMKALSDSSGNLYVLYRAAEHNTNRDTTLLLSRDGGKSFRSKTMQAWDLDACPMTMFALQNTSKGVLAAWETKGEVNVSLLSAGKESSVLTKPSAKYPVIALNKEGVLLCAWSEGAGWEKGGTVHWQVFANNFKAFSGPKNGNQELKTWSFAAAVAEPAGNFLLLY